MNPIVPLTVSWELYDTYSVTASILSSDEQVRSRSTGSTDTVLSRLSRRRSVSMRSGNIDAILWSSVSLFWRYEREELSPTERLSGLSPAGPLHNTVHSPDGPTRIPAMGSGLHSTG